MRESGSEAVGIEQWHRDEHEWWNCFSGIMAYQWELDERLNAVVRRELVDDYTRELFKAGGTLLDLGCGNGWIAFHFASMGMQVVGLDFSSEQIALANATRERKGLTNVRFECRDIVNLGDDEYTAAFDSVMINAFLHHLHPLELVRVLRSVERMLRPGGTLYIYEPLVAGEPVSSSRDISLVLMALRILMAVAVTRPQRVFGMMTEEYTSAVRQGYTGMSPHEAPVSLARLRNSFSADMSIGALCPRHFFSLPYALRTTVLTPRMRRLYSCGIELWRRIDHWLFRRYRWEELARRSFLWCMCSVTLTKARQADQ